MSEDRPQPVPTETPQEKQDVGDQLRLAGFVVAAVALLLFFFQNTQDAIIHFLWFDWKIQTIWALVLSAALGAIGMFLVMWVDRRRQARKAKERGN
jgi:uncharacterized integral membrane protein